MDLTLQSHILQFRGEAGILGAPGGRVPHDVNSEKLNICLLQGGGKKSQCPAKLALQDASSVFCSLVRGEVDTHPGTWTVMNGGPRD